jgi:hypothetical protein
VRAGAAFTIAAQVIADRLEAGETPRRDGFFEGAPGRRSAAEELLEGVIHAASESYEEQKVPFLGCLYSNLVFDETVSREHANFLINRARGLSFQQLVIIAMVWEGDFERLVQAALRDTPPQRVFFAEEVALEAYELEQLALLGAGEPGGRLSSGGLTFADPTARPLSELTLSGVGHRLFELLNLSAIPPDAREAVLAQTVQVGPPDR